MRKTAITSHESKVMFNFQFPVRSDFEIWKSLLQNRQNNVQILQFVKSLFAKRRKYFYSLTHSMNISQIDATTIMNRWHIWSIAYHYADRKLILCNDRAGIKSRCKYHRSVSKQTRFFRYCSWNYVNAFGPKVRKLQNFQSRHLHILNDGYNYDNSEMFSQRVFSLNLT